MKNIKVIISCSGKFHAFALAEQMEKHGMLLKLYTSFSSIKNPVAKFLISRRDKESIPKSKIETNLVVAIGIKLFNNPFLWNDLFDRWVAWKIKGSDADIFIGWSGMSLRSIRAAKKKGMITIVERGSSHINHQLSILEEEYKINGLSFEISEEVKAKENCEYKDSDFISVPSTFAKFTFSENDIKSDKILINNYGVGNTFKAPDNYDKNNFYVLYLGKLSLQKGVVYLIDAINKLNDLNYNIKGLFIGGIDESFKSVLNSMELHNIEFLGHVDHYELPQYISKARVAVTPSIQDGFAMVVPQILSCNIPVIVSENTGAYDIIVEGKNGFIVPIRNSNTIVEKIEMLYKNPKKLIEMKNFIGTNPIDLSWDAYGKRYVKHLNQIVFLKK